jgi:hypothetical protein
MEILLCIDPKSVSVHSAAGDADGARAFHGNLEKPSRAETMSFEKRNCTSSTVSIAKRQCNAQQVFRGFLSYRPKNLVGIDFPSACIAPVGPTSEKLTLDKRGNA